MGVIAILNDKDEDQNKKIKLFEEAREQDKEIFSSQARGSAPQRVEINKSTKSSTIMLHAWF